MLFMLQQYHPLRTKSSLSLENPQIPQLASPRQDQVETNSPGLLPKGRFALYTACNQNQRACLISGWGRIYNHLHGINAFTLHRNHHHRRESLLWMMYAGRDVTLKSVLKWLFLKKTYNSLSVSPSCKLKSLHHKHIPLSRQKSTY